MTQIPGKAKILIVAGEASGDAHAADLVAAMRAAGGGNRLEFFGATGPEMRRQGVETVVEADEFAIVGLPEVLRALPMFWGALKALKAAVRERRPDLAILVDFPEFNLKLARFLKKSGVKVVYYVSPQLWAWRRYRARTVRRHVDLLLSILPFESEWYAARDIRNVLYVGNPTVEDLETPIGKDSFCAEHGLDPARPIVALLPGSRRKEVKRILPRLLSTAWIMRRRDPSIQFVVAMAGHRSNDEVSASFARAGIDPNGFGGDLRVVFGRTVDAVGASDAAAVASGTATLETAVIGTPLAVVYRSTLLNYLILRPLVRIEHFGLVNLVAGRKLAREFLQFGFTAPAVAEELFRLLESGVNAEMRRELTEVTESLRGGSAAAKAAEAVLGVLARG